MKKPYIPAGCDQQGRYPEAAEAATDVGADDAPPHDAFRVVLKDILLSAALIAVIALIVIGVAQ